MCILDVSKPHGNRGDFTEQAVLQHRMAFPTLSPSLTPLFSYGVPVLSSTCGVLWLWVFGWETAALKSTPVRGRPEPSLILQGWCTWQGKSSLQNDSTTVNGPVPFPPAFSMAISSSIVIIFNRDSRQYYFEADSQGFIRQPDKEFQPNLQFASPFKCLSWPQCLTARKKCNPFPQLFAAALIRLLAVIILLWWEHFANLCTFTGGVLNMREDLDHWNDNFLKLSLNINNSANLHICGFFSVSWLQVWRWEWFLLLPCNNLPHWPLLSVLQALSSWVK